jgi:phage terminase large subunit
MAIVELNKVVGKGYKDYWKTRKRYRIVKGGRGSKKSTTAALNFICNIMKYRGANLLVIRKYFKDHKDSTYAQLKWAINRLGVAGLFECKLSPLEIIYIPTGQKILFRGMDDPQSLTSITVEKGVLCWVWFEEFFQISSEEDFNKVDMSIRGEMPEGLFKQITGTFNPWNEKHWIKKRFFDNPDDNTFTLTTDYTCNEFLDDADLKLFEDMRTKNPRRYKVEGLGEWGISQGLVFDNWIEREFNIQDIIKKFPQVKSCFGLDFGYTVDPSGFIASLIDPQNKKLYCFDEFYERGLLNDAIANRIKYMGYAKEEIVADSSEPKSIDEIRNYGISRIKAARKGKDSINNGIQFLSQFEIIVHPKCTNLILELNNYAWEVKDGITLSTPIDAFNHLIDPLRYSVEKYITIREFKAAPSLY